MLKLISLLILAYIVWELIKINSRKKGKKQSLMGKSQSHVVNADPKRSELIKPRKGYDIQDVPIPATSEPSTVKTVEHKKQHYLSTENERKLYFALLECLPEDYIVHCQVSLMALVQPRNFKDNSRTWAKRMDYVITDKSTRILAVIELDDYTHKWEKRQKRDVYVNAALEGHHPLVRFDTQRYYDPAVIAEILESRTEIRCNYSPVPA